MGKQLRRLRMLKCLDLLLVNVQAVRSIGQVTRVVVWPTSPIVGIVRVVVSEEECLMQLVQERATLPPVDRHATRVRKSRRGVIGTVAGLEGSHLLHHLLHIRREDAVGQVGNGRAVRIHKVEHHIVHHPNVQSKHIVWIESAIHPCST